MPRTRTLADVTRETELSTLSCEIVEMMNAKDLTPDERRAVIATIGAMFTRADRAKLAIGDRVSFDFRGTKCTGRIETINTKTCTVTNIEPLHVAPAGIRASFSLLTRID